jgi:long-chain fatty acid transport protein
MLENYLKEGESMKKKRTYGLRFFPVCLFAVLIAAVFIVGNAYATNGYFAHGYSIKNKALAGAATALPLDSLAASSNPAGMAFVGNRVDAGVTFFNPNREYTISGNPTPPPPGCMATGSCPFGLMPGTVESDSKWFVIPSIGVNWMRNKDNALGLSIYGNGGMNTDYDTNTFNLNPMLPSFGSDPTGVDLMQLFVVPTYARKLNQNHAFGISPIFAYQAFEAEGMQIFGEMGFSSDPSNISNNGHESSYGIGGRVGYLGEVLSNVYLGVSYQSRIYMSELDNYSGLFAEEGDFDIPSNWSIGLALNVTPDLTFAIDLQQIFYSEIDSINNPLLPNLMTPAGLGTDSGAGFGWEDITVVKAGIQWKSSPDWTWRAGFSITDQPIPDSEVMFNIVAPGVVEKHVTFGFTKAFKSNQEVDFAIMRAFSHDVTGPNPLDPAQTIELEMDQWEVALGYTYKF